MQAAIEKPLSGRKKTLFFERGPSWMETSLNVQGELLAFSLPVMGKTLINYNLNKIFRLEGNIGKILFPSGFSNDVDIIQESFPVVEVDEYDEPRNLESPEILRMPIDCAVLENATGYSVMPIVYPWDILRAYMKILEVEVVDTRISDDSSIADTVVLKGPCVIEDGVTVDDFTKIVGPAYLGRKTSIGTGNLVRASVLGDNSSVGFGCEIARSVLVGKNKISHHDVILDSIVGKNTWMGAFVGTTNLLLNNGSVRCKLGDNLVSTGLEHFGCVMGRGCAVGAGVIVMPGRCIPNGTLVPPGHVYSG